MCGYICTTRHVPSVILESCLTAIQYRVHTYKTICVSMCHYYQALPWWSWGEHSGCFLLWHASRCSLGEYTPVSGSTSFPQRTSRTQTWGLPSNTSHSYPSVHSTYTGELKRRREKWSLMKLLLLNWGYQVNKTSNQYNMLEMTGCASG